MGPSNISQMHVDDLASFEVFVIEMTHHELATSHIGQKLLFCDFCVLAMTFNQVFLLLLIDVFHLVHPSLTYVSHDLLFLVITKLILIIVLVVMMSEQLVLVCHIV